GGPSHSQNAELYGFGGLATRRITRSGTRRTARSGEQSPRSYSESVRASTDHSPHLRVDHHQSPTVSPAGESVGVPPPRGAWASRPHGERGRQTGVRLASCGGNARPPRVAATARPVLLVEAPARPALPRRAPHPRQSHPPSRSIC